MESFIFSAFEEPLSISALAQSLKRESSEETNSLKESFGKDWMRGALVFGSYSDLKVHSSLSK